jgi:hypothetical protein
VDHLPCASNIVVYMMKRDYAQQVFLHEDAVVVTVRLVRVPEVQKFYSTSGLSRGLVH